MPHTAYLNNMHHERNRPAITIYTSFETPAFN